MQLYLIRYETENAETACSIIAAPSIAEAIKVTENPPNDFYNQGDKVVSISLFNSLSIVDASSSLLAGWRTKCPSLV